MASQWSDLKIQLMATGENTTTWGAITNANLGTAIEDAITGSVDVSFTGSNVTLTASNSTSTQDFRNLRLNLTGTGLGALTGLTVPNIEKVYIVNNGLSDSVQITSGTGANGTATIPNGTTSIVFCTGSNKVATVIDYLPSLTLGTPLPVASGGTGSNTGVNVQSVSGVLPVANGGTGSSTAAFNGSGITNLNATAISSGTIANSYTTANSANQANAIVARDGSGDFAARNINANALTLGTALNAASGGTGLSSPGTAGNVLTSNGSAWVSSAGSFAASYTSTALAPTNGGAYSLAHGLGGVPTLIKTYAVCKTAIYGYSPGDWVDISTVQSTWTSGTAYAVGPSVSMTTSDIYIRFGATVAFGLIRKDNGGNYLVNNSTEQAKWDVYIRAWL